MPIFLILAAIIRKVITGLSVFGQPQINRLAIGVGMILRGQVGLVFPESNNVATDAEQVV